MTSTSPPATSWSIGVKSTKFSLAINMISTSGRRQSLLEVQGGIGAGKTAAENHNASFAAKVLMIPPLKIVSLRVEEDRLLTTRDFLRIVSATLNEVFVMLADPRIGPVGDGQFPYGCSLAYAPVLPTSR